MTGKIQTISFETPKNGAKRRFQYSKMTDFPNMSRINWPAIFKFHQDSIFLMAFSIAGTFFLKDDHCSVVRLIPAREDLIFMKR